MTTLFAPMTVFEPIVTPDRIVTSAPIQQLSPIVIGKAFSSYYNRYNGYYQYSPAKMICLMNRFQLRLYTCYSKNFLPFFELIKLTGDAVTNITRHGIPCFMLSFYNYACFCIYQPFPVAGGSAVSQSISACSHFVTSGHPVVSKEARIHSQ